MKVYILDRKSKGLAQMVIWLSQYKRISDVQVFEDYVDFIEKIANSPPTLCVVRLGMNEIPGLMVGGMVQQVSPDTKIVFMSYDRVYALDAYEMGVYGYLVCPVEKRKLFQCLERIENGCTS